MELPNTSSQAIDFDPTCSRQVYSNKPGTDRRYENTDPGCVLAVLRVASIMLPLRVDAKSGKVI